MIKGTNTDCKITDISVVGSTATITCLFFASATTDKPTGVRFYLYDVNSEEKYLIDNTAYWIDSINAYETNLLNVNVNGYKETRITIDITNDNKSPMQKDRWYRKCYLILANVEDLYTRALWSSDTLDLVSEPVELPDIKNLVIYNKPTTSGNISLNKLYIDFTYAYKTESDFNYNNSNLKTVAIIKSISTGNILEQIESTTKEKMLLESTSGYEYNKPILVELYITNLKGEILKSITYIYKPFIKRAYGYIKTNKGIKKIRQIVVKKEATVVSNPNNLAVKINFSTPIYAHFDRIKYTKRLFNPNTEQDEEYTFYKCLLHIDTFLSDTDFDFVMFTVNRDNITLSQKTDEDSNVIILQDDTNPRIDTERILYGINATYKSEAYTKTIGIRPNKTIVCSPKLKLHSDLRPFNYDELVGGQNNE
jgi:hypothetical protein